MQYGAHPLISNGHSKVSLCQMGKNSKKQLHSDIWLLKGNYLKWQIIISFAWFTDSITNYAVCIIFHIHYEYDL